MHNHVTYNSTTCPCHARCKCSKPYGFFKFALDVFLVCATGGIWLLWIFIREMRNR